MGKSSSTITDKRKLEILDLLRDPTLTLEAWAAKALAQPECKRIDVCKFRKGSNTQMGKMFDLAQGYETSHLEEELRTRKGCGDAQYLLSFVGPDGHWLVRSPFRVGNPDDENAPPATPTTQEQRAEADELNALRMRRIKALEVDNLILGEEAAKVNREIAPLTAMASLIKELAPKGDANQSFLTFLMEQRRIDVARMEKLETLILAGRPREGEAADPLAKSLGVLETVTDLAGRLGFVRGEGAAAESPWTPSAVLSIVQGATPLLKDGLATLRSAMGRGAPPGVPAVPADQAIPVNPPAEGEPMAKVAQSNPAMQKIIDVGYQALRSKNWPTVVAIYESVRAMPGGAMLPELDPDVDAAAYIAILSLMDSRFEAEAPHWTLFLAWLAEQEARETPPAGAEPSE